MKLIHSLLIAATAYAAPNVPRPKTASITLPVYFEPEAAKPGAAAHFSGYVSGFRASFGPNGVELSADGAPPLRMQWSGAARAPRGSQPTGGFTNQYTGKSAREWRLGVPH